MFMEYAGTVDLNSTIYCEWDSDNPGTTLTHEKISQLPVLWLVSFDLIIVVMSIIMYTHVKQPVVPPAGQPVVQADIDM
jgi:hypothetical protein